MARLQQYKQTIKSGVVMEQLVFSTFPTRHPRNAKPKPEKNMTPEDRFNYNQAKARRKFIRRVNTNFDPRGYYTTHTFSNEMLPATLSEAKKILSLYRDRLRRAFPAMKMVGVVGRGQTTNRIHCHCIIQGVPESIIAEKWIHGEVNRISKLREHNFYGMLDHGQDYTGLATYLFKHWTPEQGGSHYIRTDSTLIKPHEETPKVSKRAYSPEKPPPTPDGYMLVQAKQTQYGYQYFKYVLIPPTKPQPPRRC